MTSLVCFFLMATGYIVFLFLQIPRVFPDNITKSIDARDGWQSTDIWVKPGNRVEITVIDGVWTHWEGTQQYNQGTGGGYVCGQAMDPDNCVEPLPSYPAGGLIGRVGDEIFPVGMGTTWKSTKSGKLELRINDGDVGLYDNDGELSVKIHLEK